MESGVVGFCLLCRKEIFFVCLSELGIRKGDDVKQYL